MCGCVCKCIGVSVDVCVSVWGECGRVGVGVSTRPRGRRSL